MHSVSISLSRLGTVTNAKWYVDSVNGDDSNSGKLPSASYATIAKLLEQSIVAGDVISLAKGSEWRESLVGLPSRVTVLTYGSGARPHFNCRDVISADSWSKTGGRTNVYEATLTAEWTASKSWARAWEDTSHLTRVADIATCDSTPGSYVPDNDTASPYTLYVHTTNSDDPATNGSVYEHSARDFGFRVAAGSVFKGLKASANRNNNGSITVAGRLYDSVAAEGQFHNVFVSGGAYLEDVTADGAYRPDLSHSMFVINQNDGAGEDVTLVNCVAQQDSYASLCSGFTGHYNSGGSAFGTITYTGCSAELMPHGFSFSAGHAANIVYTNCTTANVQFPFDPNNDCTMTGCTFSEDIGINVRGVTVDSAAYTITIDDLTVNVGHVSGGAVSIISASTVTVRNSTINIDGAGGVRIGIYCTNATASITVDNVRFCGTMAKAYNFTNGPASLASDNNNFRTAGIDFTIDGVSYATLALYQAGEGQDANSVVSAC